MPLLTSHDSCVTVFMGHDSRTEGTRVAVQTPMQQVGRSIARETLATFRDRARARVVREKTRGRRSRHCVPRHRDSSARRGRARDGRVRGCGFGRARCRRGTTTGAVVDAGERRIASSRTRCDRRRGFARARTGRRTRRRDDDVARETVTYHAPAAGGGHSSRATSECGSRERDSAALTRLFHGIGDDDRGGGTGGEEEWGRGWAGRTGGGEARMTNERGRERTRGSVPAAPPWDESPIRSRSRDGRGRGSGDGGRRRSEDVLEELMSNLRYEKSTASTRDAGADVEEGRRRCLRRMRWWWTRETRTERRKTSLPASLDDYWDGGEDEDHRRRGAAEKHHAEKNGGTRDASAREEAAPSLNGFGDGDDDDEDLLAAAAAAVVDRASAGVSRAPPNRRRAGRWGRRARRFNPPKTGRTPPPMSR